MPLPVPASLGIFQSSSVEPMQVDAPPEENDASEEEVYIVENPTLDLEAYIANYAGLAKLYRLLYIADHCPSLRIEALKMALSYVQSTYNFSMYRMIHRKLLDAAGNSNLPDVTGGLNAGIVPLDTQWIETKSKKAALKLEKLDTDLKNYKSNSIKESIRRGHDDLGDHYLDCGDLSNALKCYSRARDYCTSGRHVINMCLNVIKVSVYLQNWSHVLTYVNKAEATPEVSEVNGKDTNQVVVTKLKTAAGLAELATRKYKSAAKNFLQASFDHCDFPDVSKLSYLVPLKPIHLQDKSTLSLIDITQTFGGYSGGDQDNEDWLISVNNIAMYGGLCALASFDRQELLKYVISSSSFKLFLELEPQLRDIIFRFYESKYAACLKLLNEIKDNLLLDMYLAPHVNSLYLQIRNRGLVQYFSPYLSADMNKMAVAFNTTVNELEDELMVLILDNQIQARIDSHNKILYAKDIDERSQTYERAIRMGKEYQRRTIQLILRSAMLRNQIQVKSPPREGSQGLDVSVSPLNCAPRS